MQLVELDTTDRAVVCHECRRQFAHADMRITIGKHTVALCREHVVALIDALTDFDTFVAQQVRALFAESPRSSTAAVEKATGRRATRR